MVGSRRFGARERGESKLRREEVMKQLDVRNPPMSRACEEQEQMYSTALAENRHDGR